MAEQEKFFIVSDEDVPQMIVRGKEEIHDGPDGKPYKHRAVHVLVESFGGKFIIQKKAPGTENAGKWSSAASGHVRACESYELAAMRELKEELGLTAPLMELFELGTIKPCNETGNEFVKVFGYLMDPTKEMIQINHEEVSQVAIVRLIDLLKDVKANPDIYSPAFLLAMQELVDIGGYHNVSH